MCRDPDGTQEICLKTQHDGWVIGRKAGDRELFVLFDAKLASLTDVQGVCVAFSFVIVVYFHSNLCCCTDALAKLRGETFFNTIFLQ